MGTDDRIANAAEDLKGKAKEAWGDATDNEQLEAEGKMDQAKASVKDKVEDVKDAVAEKFNDMTDGDRTRSSPRAHGARRSRRRAFVAARWGGRDLNPRPMDYESTALTG